MQQFITCNLKPITDTELYKTILVIVTGLLVICYITENHYFFLAAAVIGLVSLVVPVAGRYIVFGWTKIGEGLGWVNGRIILSAIFFLFLTPIALLYRLTKKNPLNLKKDNSPSLFHERNHTYNKKDLKNVW
jgi:hypothetical protein